MASRGRLLLIAGAVLAAALSAQFVYHRIELAPFWYPIVGVDVSNHQGKIDWQRLASSGIAFAYIKATEGATFRDKSFARNWSETSRVGVPRGAYHFFNLCRSAADQAKNFIEMVPKDPNALAPAVDAELLGPCAKSATASDHVAELEEFLVAIEKHYGRRPIIYTTREYDTSILQGALSAERFWARSLTLPPSFREQQWVIWQYHNKGRRPGVEGALDLNVFRGSEEDFKRFAAGGYGQGATP